ncbi:hypothetical protein D3C72_1313020 [compost metagenome]
MRGFGDDHRVERTELGRRDGALQRRHRGQGAVARVFFFKHAVESHRTRRLHAQLAQRLERRQRADDAGLHVARAAAVQPAIA